MEPKGQVLSLCDRTGIMVEDWAEAGYHCTIVDLQHPAGYLDPSKTGRKNIWTVGANVKGFRAPDSGGDPWSIVFAFPPCTDMAVSGARWMPSKGLKALIGALQIVEACRRTCEASGAPWMLEHPVSTLSSYWRKPDWSFDPWEYAGYLEDPQLETYTKRTNLWVGGGFLPPPRRPVAPLPTINQSTGAHNHDEHIARLNKIPSKMHLMPPSPDRANLRAATPRGFAKAVFQTMEPIVRRKAVSSF